MSATKIPIPGTGEAVYMEPSDSPYTGPVTMKRYSGADLKRAADCVLSISGGAARRFAAAEALAEYIFAPDDPNRAQFLDTMNRSIRARAGMPPAATSALPQPAYAEGHGVAWGGEGRAMHRCKACGCLWRLNAPTAAQPDGSWSLWDGHQKPGKCCNNVAMGGQIERVCHAESTAAPPAPACAPTLWV